MGGNKCAIKSCRRHSNENCGELRFFRFPNPKQLDRIQKWKIACGDDQIMMMDPIRLHSSYRICSLHFEENVKKRFLNENAVPTLYLKAVPSVHEEHNYFKDNDIDVGCLIEIDDRKSKRTRSISTQTELEKVNVGTQTSYVGKSDCQIQTEMRLTAKTPRKLKLIEKIKDLNEDVKKIVQVKKKLEKDYSKSNECKNITKRDFREACDKHLPQFLGNMVKEVSDLKDRKLKGRRYSLEFKKHALSVFYQSPKMYKSFVQKYHFPSICTLRRMTGNIQQYPGLNNMMFDLLKTKMNEKGKSERMCVLTMDEVSLKANLFYDIKRDEIIGYQDLGFGKSEKPARNALVLMARGINENWKQPLAYFFLHTTCEVAYLKKIVTDCIRKLNETGISVRALISDMGSNFIKLSRQLGINSNNSVFQVDDKKIFYLFDTPHLMKAVRNVLLKYTVIFDGQEASWKDVERIYIMEKERDLRMIPKLTEAHVNPTNFERMKVKYATQVFSSTVVAAMSTYIANGQISSSAMGTANMLEKFDHLFDILNSSTRRTKNQYKLPYRGTESQNNFLKEMLKSIKDIEVHNKNKKTGKSLITGTFKVMNCFQVTIRGIMGLWEDLKKEGVTELRTRRLNQDCLENFFGKIRQQQGNSVNPTPVQFMNAFKKFTSLDLLDCSEKFNCEADSDTLLIANNDKIPTDLRYKETRSQFKITNADFRHNDLPTKNVETYISGYLIRKCLRKHRCEKCEEFSKSSDAVDSTKLFCHFKGDTEKYGRRTGDYGKLLMPHYSFINYISSLESLVMKYFKSIALRKVGKELYEKLKIIEFKHPCTEFPYDYLLRLYIRLRTYYIVKYANRKFQVEQMFRRREKKNRKMDILRHN